MVFKKKTGTYLAHGTLLNVMWEPGWRGGCCRRMDTCVCVTESLDCSPEAITTLLTGYTPIQYKKFIINKEMEPGPITEVFSGNMCSRPPRPKK